MGKIFYVMGKSSSGKDTVYEGIKTAQNRALYDKAYSRG